jgi:hypothetical protein
MLNRLRGLLIMLTYYFIVACGFALYFVFMRLLFGRRSRANITICFCVALTVPQMTFAQFEQQTIPRDGLPVPVTLTARVQIYALSHVTASGFSMMAGVGSVDAHTYMQYVQGSAVPFGGVGFDQTLTLREPVSWQMWSATAQRSLVYGGAGHPTLPWDGTLPPGFPYYNAIGISNAGLVCEMQLRDFGSYYAASYPIGHRYKRLTFDQYTIKRSAYYPTVAGQLRIQIPRGGAYCDIWIDAPNGSIAKQRLYPGINFSSSTLPLQGRIRYQCSKPFSGDINELAWSIMGSSFSTTVGAFEPGFVEVPITSTFTGATTQPSTQPGDEISGEYSLKSVGNRIKEKYDVVPDKPRIFRNPDLRLRTCETAAECISSLGSAINSIRNVSYEVALLPSDASGNAFTLDKFVRQTVEGVETLKGVFDGSLFLLSVVGTIGMLIGTVASVWKMILWGLGARGWDMVPGPLDTEV